MSADSDDLEKAIGALLAADAGVAAIVGTRIYIESAPNSAATPYIIFHETSQVPDESIGGEIGLSTAEIQIDVYADTTIARQNATRAVKHALSHFHGARGNAFINRTTISGIIKSVSDKLDGTEATWHKSEITADVIYSTDIPS